MLFRPPFIIILLLYATGLEWRVFKSACLPKKFREEWSFGGLTYTVSGIPDGESQPTHWIC